MTLPAARLTAGTPRVDVPEAGRFDAVATARRVLRAEQAGLAALEVGLGEAFADAVARLAQAAGRVVVTGMGKSGHVARKIAATLASTGTPAQFVHPAEASHGDLGMITSGDVVVALSSSGETAELSAIVTYARRFAIPLIAITQRASSALAEAADIALLLPAAPEACPLGLAPTTSTTMMLALGDALAVALLERRGFSAADFQVLHPGGSLGRRLLHVADLMHGGADLPLVSRDRPVGEAILTMTAKGLGVVVVIGRDGRLAGIVTDGDLRRNMGDALLRLRVEEIMTPTPKTIRARALAAEALGLMNAAKIGCLVVVDDAGLPTGVIHVHDCLKAGVA